MYSIYVLRNKRDQRFIFCYQLREISCFLLKNSTRHWTATLINRKRSLCVYKLVKVKILIIRPIFSTNFFCIRATGKIKKIYYSDEDILSTRRGMDNGELLKYKTVHKNGKYSNSLFLKFRRLKYWLHWLRVNIKLNENAATILNMLEL